MSRRPSRSALARWLRARCLAPPGRLPLDLNEQSKAGTAGRFDPETAVKKVEWDFAGKHVGKPSVPWTFETPGEYPVSLTVTDTRGDSRTRSFKVVVTP